MTLPPALLTGLHNLRLLGNDAAHIDARDYDEVGEAEVHAAIKVTKTVLQSVYQLDTLVDELNALKKTE